MSSGRVQHVEEESVHWNAGQMNNWKKNTLADIASTFKERRDRERGRVQKVLCQSLQVLALSSED